MSQTSIIMYLKEVINMFRKIIKKLFVHKCLGVYTVVSKEKREVNEKLLIKKPLVTSGMFKSFNDREKFYKELFSFCNQQ